MATLDVLDYVVRLDEALARVMPPGERKLATRDVKHLVEDLAFRFAFMDGRVAPDDIDYARALEALKDPPRAADSFAAHRPRYRKRVMRKRVVSWTVLALVALAGTAFATLVTSEEADVLVDQWRVGYAERATESHRLGFDVVEGTKRLQFTAQVIVTGGRDAPAGSSITFLVLDPAGNVKAERTFAGTTSVYYKGAIEAPGPGRWEVFVDFHDAAGASDVTILGVHPA